ncbi:hypothetical protein QTL95_26665 [Rhizobium sp. S152]|uniref:hypothetical protein n=1 Tax=Rhizobium sp. S152 TaxID=3055038 RepID=UPI0025AA1BE7|nr:hypothetical protein [Rhizobium sp. S152]MDM9629472.1 hypothetical protein [Rhizobium sp. S152]
MPSKTIRKPRTSNKPTIETDVASTKPTAASPARARSAGKPRAMASREGAESGTISRAVDKAPLTEDAGAADTEKDLQDHLAEMEALAPLDYVATPEPSDAVSDESQADRLQALRDEVDNLRSRLAIIREQATTVVKANAEWADASAHAQLGAYPWGKLAGTMAAVFIAARLIKRSRLL